MDDGVSRRESFIGGLAFLLPAWAPAANAQEAQDRARGLPIGNGAGPISVRDAGARGDGATDDTAAFSAALDRSSTIHVPAGRYRVGSIGPQEYQKAVHLRGEGAASVLELNQPKRPALRVGAVGGGFGDVRALTSVEQMTFKRAPDGTRSEALTALDIRAAHPYSLREIVMLGLGPAAIKLTSCYYGSIQNASLANSGLTLTDVNNCSIIASDIRPDEFSDKSRGADLFSRSGRYPLELIDSNKTVLSGVVLEGWDCPVVLLRRSSNLVVDGCWLEALRSPTHVIRWEHARSLDIVNSWLDFSEPYRGCFIEVDNSSSGPDSPRSEISQIRIRGGTLIASGRAFGDSAKLVAVRNRERVRVLIEGLTFRGGCLNGDRTVDFDIRSITLSGPLRHYLYSLPNARIERDWNSWMPDSVQQDWDLQTINLAPRSSGLAVARTRTPGEFMTGTGGIRVAGIRPGTGGTVRHQAPERLGPVTKAGQSYLVFIRVKCDKDASIKIEINGGFVDFAAAPMIDLPSGTWRDILFKTQEDVTWAQGRFHAPAIMIYAHNRSDGDANLFIDRMDYMILDGDHAV